MHGEACTARQRGRSARRRLTSRTPLACSSPTALSLMDTWLPLVSSTSTCGKREGAQVGGADGRRRRRRQEHSAGGRQTSSSPPCLSPTASHLLLNVQRRQERPRRQLLHMVREALDKGPAWQAARKEGCRSGHASVGRQHGRQGEEDAIRKSSRQEAGKPPHSLVLFKHAGVHGGAHHVAVVHPRVLLLELRRGVEIATTGRARGQGGRR